METNQQCRKFIGSKTVLFTWNFLSRLFSKQKLFLFFLKCTGLHCFCRFILQIKLRTLNSLVRLICCGVFHSYLVVSHWNSFALSVFEMPVGDRSPANFLITFAARLCPSHWMSTVWACPHAAQNHTISLRLHIHSFSSVNRSHSMNSPAISSACRTITFVVGHNVWLMGQCEQCYRSWWHWLVSGARFAAYRKPNKFSLSTL